MSSANNEELVVGAGVASSPNSDFELAFDESGDAPVGDVPKSDMTRSET